MADTSTEKITLALENLALAVNKAVENMNRIESKRETVVSTDRASEKAVQSKETGGKSESTKSKEKGLMSPSPLALGVGGAALGAAAYVAHKSGLGEVIGSKIDNYFGGSVREGAMKDLQGFLDAGVRPSDEDMKTIIEMQKKQNDLKTETTERLYVNTQPPALKAASEFATQALNLPQAWGKEEGFRDQVMNNFGAVANDTMSRVGDLLSGKLSFSDYIRGF